MSPANQFDFSVEEDINPLKQRFFRDVMSRPGVSPIAAAQMSLRHSRALDDTADRIAKQRASDVQYEFAVFSLDQAREKASRERDQMDQLAPLQQQLDAVINAPADHTSRLRMLGQVGVQNAHQFATNPAASFAYDSARRALTADAPEPAPKLTAASYLGRGGQLDFLRDWARDNEIELSENTTIPFSVFAEGIERTSVDKADTSTQAKMLEEQRKKQDADLKILGRGLEKVEFEKDPRTNLPVGDSFADPQTDFFIKQALTEFGTPDEREQATGLSPRERLNLARRIIAEAQLGKRSQAVPAPTRSAASLYISP
jgi:hypothetical protein